METKERWQTEWEVSQDSGGEPGQWKAQERETQGVSQDGGKHKDWRIVNRSRLMTSQKKKSKKVFSIWQPEIQQSRQTAKRSYPPIKPLTCHQTPYPQ
jgi:hypothetical protein